MSAAMIGRESEREAIERWLASAWPGVLKIDGVAGIGKSTLWSFAVDQARSRAVRVMAWRSSIAERDIAFAVLTALFDTPAVAGALAGLVDARRHALEVALGRADPTEGSAGPGKVGLAVVDVLRILSSEGPVLLGIDDLQWIDQASEDVLAYATRRLTDEPVGFLFARRTEPGQGRTGASLAEAVDRQTRLEVGPLTVGALGRLMRERLGVALARPLLVRIHTACSGNCFLALEVSRSLLARSAAPGPGEPFPVPAEAGPLVRDHLATLTATARRAVVAVAMCPDPRLELVRQALGGRGAKAIDEACRLGILQAEGGRLRPVHPLFTSTAYADAPPGERRALRNTLASLVDDPVERAIHLAETVDGRDGTIADALATAGRLALARGAPPVAADLLYRAAQCAVNDDRRAAILVEAAKAAIAAGDAERGEAILRAALENVAAGQIRAEALLALGDVVYVQRPADALPLLVSALEHTGGDAILEATVHSHIAGMADLDPAWANRSAERAAQILEQAGVEPDPDHLACASLERAFHHLLQGQPASNEDIERGLALRTGRGDTFIARRAQEVASRCLFHCGRLAEARLVDEAEYQRLVELGEFGLLPPMAQNLSVLTQLAGDWQAARRHAYECMDLVAQGAEPWRERAMLAVARVQAWEGDLDAARSMAIPALAWQEAAGDRWEAVIFCAVLGFVELSVPDPPAALGYLLRALEHADAIEVRLPTQFRFLGDLVEAAVLGGDLDLAERVLADRLEALAQRQPLPWTQVMAHRGRGHLVAAQGDVAGAVNHFDAAMAVFDSSLAMPFERARTLLARGQAHRRGGQRRAAREDLGAASAIFTGLGAQAWLARTRRELASVGGRAATGSALTASELRVAELAASGRSNKEIAAALMVSARTIESQLSAVYRKLNVRSRGQLAAAIRSGE